MTDESEYMLTTLDNPFNPFVDFDRWYNFDVQKGYNTCSYLSRIAKTGIELSEADNVAAINAAIDEILEFNLLGNYAKIYRNGTKVA